MAFEVRYDEGNDCLICRYSGRLDRDSLQPYADKILRAAAEHACRRLLNDLREADVDLSTVDVFHLPGVPEAAGLGHSWKRAVVADEQLEDLRLYKTVAQNRGYRVRTFGDVDEAMEWLV